MIPLDAHTTDTDVSEIAWGADLAQARRHVEIFEFLFELTLRRTQLVPFGG